jgi:hypothetical protein
MLVGRIEVDLRELEAVENLALEADLAAQILETEADRPILEAVKEGLQSARDQLHGGTEA